MSEDALKRKALGIKKARLREAKEGIHSWQNPHNSIENEYSRSKINASKRNLSKIILYSATTEFPGTIKIGWTYDINIREKDPRCHKLSNFDILLEDIPDKILLIEKEIKRKFYSKEYFDLYGSTEIFPEKLKDEILNFVNEFNKPSTTIPKGSTS